LPCLNDSVMSAVLLGTDENGFAVTDERIDIIADGAGEEIPMADFLQVYPLHADLEAVGFGRLQTLFASKLAQKNEIYFVADSITMVFADTLIYSGQAQRNNRIAGFFQQFAFDCFMQHFAAVLTAAGQGVVFTKAGTASVNEHFSLMDDDCFGGIANGHEAQSLLN